MSGRLALAALALPALVAAHPLGNFTINRYAALRAGADRLTVRYVVDMAEIPAFQEIAAIDRNGNGAIEPAERDAYLGRVPGEIAARLYVTLDGQALSLRPEAGRLEFPPGAGGLPTLRLEVDLGAARPALGRLEFRDRNFAGRPGWQEVVAEASGGLRLVGSTVPATDRSQALRAYPTDLLAAPPQVSEARFRIAVPAPGTASATPVERADAEPAAAGPPRFADRLTELVATRAPLGPGLVVTSLLLAAVLGATHALGPGHGKTIVGAYLVGARGTARHALLLGLVVTLTHTLGVYALGAVTLVASQWVVPERLFPWMSAVSGLMVLGIGASLARTRLAAAVGIDLDGHAHHHLEDEPHDHGAGSHHHHHHPHPHVPAALTWRGLVALGVSGGLLPCPSALVVMLGAIALGRIAFGLALIVAFSVGLAGVLTVVGLIFVHARRWFERMPAGGVVMRYAPVAGALAVSLAGLFIFVQALAQIGVLRPGT